MRFKHISVLAVSVCAAIVNAQPRVFNDPFMASLQSATDSYNALLDFSVPKQPKLAELPLATAPEKPYSLQELLFLAAQDNPTVRVAQSRLAAAKADLAGAKAQRMPTLKVETAGSFIGNPIGPISITAGELGSYNDIPIPNRDVLIYKGMESSNYKFSVISDIPIFTWNKISMGIEAAEQGLQIAELQLLKTRHELNIRVSANFEALAFLETSFGILELEKSIGIRLTDIAEKSVASGFLTKSELLNTRIKLKELDIAQARIAEKRDKIVAELAKTCNLPGLSALDLSLEKPKAQKPLWSESEAYDLIIKSSYDMRILTTLISIKDQLQLLSKTQARGLPDIGLHVELSYAGSRFPFIEQDWFRKDDYQLTISLGTSGNIFGNAVKAGEAVKAAAEYQETVERKDEALASIRGVLRETYLGLELARIRLEYALLKQEGWQKEISQMRSELSAGGGTESDYLSRIMEALGGLAEAYGTIIEYRSLLYTLEAMAGPQ